MGTYRTPDCDLIEDYVRGLAPGIHDNQCGVDHDNRDDFVLWLGLLPQSRLSQVRFTQEEYQSGVWKKIIQTALEKANV